MFDNLITYHLEQGLLRSNFSFRHIFSYFSHEWRRLTNIAALPIIICTDVLPCNLENVIRFMRPCASADRK